MCKESFLGLDLGHATYGSLVQPKGGYDWYSCLECEYVAQASSMHRLKKRFLGNYVKTAGGGYSVGVGRII